MTAGPGGNRKVGISISSPRDWCPIDPSGLPRLVGRRPTSVCTFSLASSGAAIQTRRLGGGRGAAEVGLILGLPHHHCPGDARHLVGQGDGDEQPRFGLEQPGDPAIRFRPFAVEHRLGAVDQQPAQIDVALLADRCQRTSPPEEFCLAPGRSRPTGRGHKQSAAALAPAAPGRSRGSGQSRRSRSAGGCTGWSDAMPGSVCRAPRSAPSAPSRAGPAPTRPGAAVRARFPARPARPPVP
jgi:hypothetical protein